MTNEIDQTNFPLAGTSSSSAGGVSPRVSMMEEITSTHMNAINNAVDVMISAPPKEAREMAGIIRERIADASVVVDNDSRGATASASTLNSVMMEAFRQNAEKALILAQDLAGTKSPSEAFAVQSAYFEDQRQALMVQAAAFQNAFMKMMTALTQAMAYPPKARP